jgi:transcription initiation factor TFIID subunit 9B
MQTGMAGLVAHDHSLNDIARNEEIPHDARAIARILKSMGVERCEPRVVDQLLGFMHRYISEILQDSLLYCEHAGRKPDQMQVEDVQLAVSTRVGDQSSSFAQPPLEFLLELSQQTNAVRLPQINKKYGVSLPPDQFCLTEVTYQVEPNKSRTDATNGLSSSSDNSSSSSSSSASSSSTVYSSTSLPDSLPVPTLPPPTATPTAAQTEQRVSFKLKQPQPQSQ